MKNWLVELISDDSGSATADYALVTIIVPVLCIVGLVTVGISMLIGAPLLSAPSAIIEMFGTGLLIR